MLSRDLFKTPIEKNHRLQSLLNIKEIDLRIKRDDLFPMTGGGIKARKMYYIMHDLLNHKKDVIVTTGGPQSNHARAAALMAAKKGIKCHLVIVLESGINYPLTGNILLMQMSGANIEYCKKEEISERMDKAIEHYKNSGYNPAYVWGGGHNYAGTQAFVEAAEEAQDQCGNWIPDYLVIASGTGSTQAGLAIGYSNEKTKIIGISVAREAKRGATIIEECIDRYYDSLGEIRHAINIDFKDSWTCGGYEKIKPQLISLISHAAKAGLILDPTYSGKGFYGLIDLIKTKEIKPGSKVIFWHSGGIMNLMASSNFATKNFSIK